MPKQEGQKSKLVTLLRILEQRTDENHRLNVPQLVQLLENQGILAERKSIYSDLEALQSFGLDLIRVRDGNITCWYIGERVFQLPELRLLADSVQSSRFITRKKSLELIAKLEGLTSVHQAKELRRQVVRSVRQQAIDLLDDVHVPHICHSQRHHLFSLSLPRVKPACQALGGQGSGLISSNRGLV